MTQTELTNYAKQSEPLYAVLINHPGTETQIRDYLKSYNIHETELAVGWVEFVERVKGGKND